MDNTHNLDVYYVPSLDGCEILALDLEVQKHVHANTYSTTKWNKTTQKIFWGAIGTIHNLHTYVTNWGNHVYVVTRLDWEDGKVNLRRWSNIYIYIFWIRRRDYSLAVKQEYFSEAIWGAVQFVLPRQNSNSVTRAASGSHEPYIL